MIGKPAEKKAEKKTEKKPATAASTSKVTKPTAKPTAAKKPAAAKSATAAKSAASKPASKPVLKLASKPLISKPKKNVQAAKKTPKGGKSAAPVQKALKAQKKVIFRIDFPKKSLIFLISLYLRQYYSCI